MVKTASVGNWSVQLQCRKIVQADWRIYIQFTSWPYSSYGKASSMEKRVSEASVPAWWKQSRRRHRVLAAAGIMEKAHVVEVINVEEDGDLFVGNRRTSRSGDMNVLKEDCVATAGWQKSLSQDTSRRRKLHCGKCGKPGHNRVTCGRAAFRFCLPTRICEKCGKPGHYSILCSESSASAMIPTRSDMRKDDPEMGSLGTEERGDNRERICMWHLMKNHGSVKFG